MSDWKETLHMPHTGFEMRGGLAKKEPLILQKWEEERLYEKMRERRRGAKSYVLHDGPPYANNNLHMGTSMNRCLKDVIVKSHYMMGYDTPFYPGWDTHGLPIENMMPRLGIDRKKMSTADFRDQCEQYAKEQIKIQMATEKRLGCLGDYEHPYITLDKEYEADEVRAFAKMAMGGLIYQGLKPIYWSPERESAVADMETYYQDRTDMTIYVTFDVLDGRGVLEGDEKFVIWTTTPWTIPADDAITLNADLDYALVQTEKGKLIFLASKVDALCAKFGCEEKKVLKVFKGRQLEGVTTRHPFYNPEENPFYDRVSPVCLAEYVTDQDGTGCVHTAGGHGYDDYLTGLRYNLPIFCPVDEKGRMTAEAGKDIEGMYVFDANPVIIEKLDRLGCLLAKEPLTHSYPYDERMKKPVIFRATVQWFASIDKIRAGLLDQVENHIQWQNDFGRIRMYNMIKDRQDWCISRQRVWGVPIPILYTEDKKPIFQQEVFDHIADLFEQYGSNVWFEREAKDLLPEGYTNPASPNGRFTKEQDIMDVWFDSGSSWMTLLKRGMEYPCDLYFEGSDQYRGWFNSSLIVSYANTGKAPYKSVLSHGYVLDGKGYQMHKSAGNAVDPQVIIRKYGADIIRLWAATSDYRQDVRCSDELFRHVSDQYRKVRNTFRFMLSVTDRTDQSGEKDFDPKKDRAAYDDMPLIDRYMEVRRNDLLCRVVRAYQEYDFVAATTLLTNFMTNELSSFYLDYGKDILYILRTDDPRRRCAQTVVYDCLDTCLKLWAPILSFTAEEVWSFDSGYDGKSVFLREFPAAIDYPDREELEEFGKKFFALRDDVLKVLEQARDTDLIHKSLEASLDISLKDQYAEIRDRIREQDLAQLLIVSKVRYAVNEGTDMPSARILVKKAEGSVCRRCWNIVDSVDDRGLCGRCADVVGK